MQDVVLNQMSFSPGTSLSFETNALCAVASARLLCFRYTNESHALTDETACAAATANRRILRKKAYKPLSPGIPDYSIGRDWMVDTAKSPEATSRATSPSKCA